MTGDPVVRDGITGTGMIRPDPVDRLRDAINSHDPQHLHARVLRRAVAGPDIWSEWEMAATDAPDAPVLRCGPVIMTTRGGRITGTRFSVGPVTPAGVTS